MAAGVSARRFMASDKQRDLLCRSADHAGGTGQGHPEAGHHHGADCGEGATMSSAHVDSACSLHRHRPQHLRNIPCQARSAAAAARSMWASTRGTPGAGSCGTATTSSGDGRPTTPRVEPSSWTWTRCPWRPTPRLGSLVRLPRTSNTDTLVSTQPCLCPSPAVTTRPPWTTTSKAALRHHLLIRAGTHTV